MESKNEYGAIITLIVVLVGVFFTYPTIHPIVQSQGSTEILPLIIIDGKPSHIKLRNDGEVSVLINVNFSSDGSIQFKSDNRQIKDKFEVQYSVNKNEIVDFRFIPIFNTSSENATLIVNYRSTIEHFNLPTRYPEGTYTGNYEKTVTRVGVGDKWEIT